MVGAHERRIRANLKRLAAIHAATISLLEDSIAILQFELDVISEARALHGQKEPQHVSSKQPVIDRDTMCVLYRGRQCFLGNTLMLKLFERLARRPNAYVSHDVLLSEVWKGVRERSSVRSVIKELRNRFRAAGMSPLADAIDGHVSGHYGLMLNSIR